MSSASSISRSIATDAYSPESQDYSMADAFSAAISPPTLPSAAPLEKMPIMRKLYGISLEKIFKLNNRK